jgi:hypothetical protein
MSLASLELPLGLALFVFGTVFGAHAVADSRQAITYGHASGHRHAECPTHFNGLTANTGFLGFRYWLGTTGIAANKALII